jgi:hypothetical protein
MKALALALLVGCSSLPPDVKDAARDTLGDALKAGLRAAAVAACVDLTPAPQAHPTLRLAWALACSPFVNPGTTPSPATARHLSPAREAEGVSP